MTFDSKVRSFRHGVHPDDHKQATHHLRIERIPFGASLILPLSQHAGKPSRPVVDAGDRVVRGQLLAEADGFISTSLHSPATGRVAAMARRRHPNGSLVDAIEIEVDPFSSQELHPTTLADWREMSGEEFVASAQLAGLVGLGGAAFPSHVKYSVPAGKRIRHVVINGCECEPYLTCDHRTMVERADDVVHGIRILLAKTGAERATIGVEANKPDATDALVKAVGDDSSIVVAPLKVKYPQGAEKMLIKALFGAEVPAGKLPLDLEMLVNNVGTMAAITDWFERGQPLIERVLTVSGPGVRRPANVLAPVGTPVREVLRHCGGLAEDVREVVMGGPMMGNALPSLDVPILKGSSGVLAFTEAELSDSNEYSCVKCGRCLDACSNFLNPSRLGRLAAAGRWDDLEPHHLMDCMECGACSYACPSNIPIVQLIRVAKSTLRERKAAPK